MNFKQKPPRLLKPRRFNTMNPINKKMNFMSDNFRKLTPRQKLISGSKIFIPIIIGATGGYLYYHFIGCVSGTCPITSNPYISTGYGAAIGALMVNWKSKTKKD